MFSLKSMFRALVSAPAQALNDNSRGPSIASHASDEPADGRVCDPYWCDAVEAKRLIGSARLISAVDGSSSAVLNVLATRRPAA